MTWQIATLMASKKLGMWSWTTHDSSHARVDVAAGVDVQERARSEGHLHLSGPEASEAVDGGRLIGHAGGDRNLCAEDVDVGVREVIARAVHDFRHDRLWNSTRQVFKERLKSWSRGLMDRTLGS